MKKKVKKIVKKIQKKTWKDQLRQVWPLLMILVVFVALVSMLVFSYGRSYTGRVFPGVHIGDVPIGGLSEEALTDLLEEMQAKVQNAGVSVTLPGEEEKKVIFFAQAADQGGPFVFSFDIEQEVTGLIHYNKGRGGNMAQAFRAWQFRLQKPDLSLRHVRVDTVRIQAALEEEIGTLSKAVQDARIEVESFDPFTYRMVSSSPGLMLDLSQLEEEVRADLIKLESIDISIANNQVDPAVDETRLEAAVTVLGDPLFQPGALQLEQRDDNDTVLNTWEIPQRQIAAWLELKDIAGEDRFIFNPSSTRAYIEEVIAPVIMQEAKDALFVQDASGKVINFRPSQPGRALDEEATLDLIQAALLARQQTYLEIQDPIRLPIHEVAPEVSLEESNDLGIRELLGVGQSSFSGSPQNRVKNIQNGVRKIQGLLIAPGEEFSTVQATKPYTLAGGYFEEKIIIGNSVEDGIGGGLCQISSTLFRSVMNSALEITERRNHGFAVSYYNVNGKPGVDATIFDSKPDFRFRNDTDHHILIWAEVDLVNYDLYFSFWGTSDGREGSFTEPVVSRWIPHGPTEYIETTDLAPGEQECKYAYTGAEASFTYNRIMGDGSDNSIVYNSYYRPLAQKCLVGVASLPSTEASAAEEAAVQTSPTQGLDGEVINPATPFFNFD